MRVGQTVGLRLEAEVHLATGKAAERSINSTLLQLYYCNCNQLLSTATASATLAAANCNLRHDPPLEMSGADLFHHPPLNAPLVHTELHW